MVVYVEYVLIGNFIIDYLLLKTSVRFCSAAGKPVRIIITSVSGALLSLLYPLTGLSGFLLTAFKALSGISLVLFCAKYRSYKQFIKCSICFFILTFCAGGAVYGAVNLFGLKEGGKTVVLLSVFITYLSLKGMKKAVGTAKRTNLNGAFIYDCEVSKGDKRLKIKGFLDTGNLSYDGDLPVVFLSEKIFGELLYDKISLGVLSELAVTTVGGKKSLPKIKIDELCVYKEDGKVIYCNVTACTGKVGDGYDALLHPAFFVKGGKNEFKKGA